MTIGFIYIATGPYIEFFTDFYDTAEKYFIPEAQKFYYVFTDRSHPYFEKPNVIHIPQHQEYWPDVALHKYHYVLQAQHLYTTDYLILTNANIVFQRLIQAEEVLPSAKENYIFAVSESLQYRTGKFVLADSFEENPLSAAFVPEEKRFDYFCAGFWGGRKKEFLELTLKARNLTEIDLSKGIYARWEDQAYLNKCLYDLKKFKILSPSFCYIETLKIPFEPKVLVVLKEKRRGSKTYYRRYKWKEQQQHFQSGIKKYRHYLIYYAIKLLNKLEK